MTQIVFDKFSSGLDRRKSRDTAGADALYQLKNAQVTAGHELSKRSCAALQDTLEAGTVALRSGLGKLNVFTSSFAVAVGNPAYRVCFVPHPTSTIRTLSKVHSVEAFRGYLYAACEYDDGSVFHHYLDPGSASATPRFASPKWIALTAYATTSPHFVTPITPNGWRYQCTTGGTSAAGEPTWPTTLDATVVDGTVTWTCRSFRVVDANCPNTKSIAKGGLGKIFAIAGEVVRFCAGAAGRDWTTASDAGFLATGTHQDDSSDALAVGLFKSILAVYFADAIQLWTLDPDPAKIVLRDIISNTGTRFPRSPGQVSQDTLYLSDNGFRSLQLSENFDQLQDNDLGAPVDSLVKPLIIDGLAPYSEWYPQAGQFWCVLGETVWAFTYSRTSKVNAWSELRFPWAVDDMTVLNGKLYARQGNDVYLVDENAHQDGTEPPEVIIEFPFLDFKAPGDLKIIQGMDFSGAGTCEISFKYRSVDIAGNLTEGETDPLTVTGNTMPGVMTPVELCVVALAPRIRHKANEAFRLSRLAFYYETLGAL